MAWQLLNVTKANFDLTDFVPAESLAYTHSAYGEISTLAFRAEDDAGTLDLDPEDELVLTDGGVKAFAGYLRQLNQTDDGRSSARVFDCIAQDYTSALSDDVVDVPFFRDGNESDKSVITALFAAFGTRGVVVGTEVQTLRATMGVGQEFFGLNLHQAVTEVEKIVGASFFVDFDKRLHHYTSESNAAPFNVSDDPNYSTTFEYEAFRLPQDSVETVNAVFVIGDGISGWRYKGGSPPAAGSRRAAVLRNDEVKTQAQLDVFGDAYLASNSDPRLPGQLITFRGGLRAGMTLQVTHAGHGLTAVSYRIQSIEARGQTRDRIAYSVRFGSKPVTLGEVIGRTTQELGRVASVLSDTQTKVLDLSIAGANVVPNSSLEDGTAWSVGAQWVIGFDPTPNAAYAGTKVGRVTLAAQTAGNLVTPLITVDRTDDWWISAFRFIRSRTSGTFRIYVEELDSTNALLRTTVANFTAVDTEWKRQAWHFGPAASADVIAWMPTTAKVRLGFSSAGAAATLSADVDGAQIERSKILTAYAPSPTDLLTAPITTTQIADDAITTPKLATNAVVAGKIAAGAVTTDVLAAGAVTAGKMEIGGSVIGETLLSDPDWEWYAAGDTSYWAVNGDFAVLGVAEATTFRQYRNRAVMTGAGVSTANDLIVGSTNGPDKGCIPVTPGAQYYTITVQHAITQVGAGDRHRILLRVYDSSFVLLASPQLELFSSGRTWPTISTYRLKTNAAATPTDVAIAHSLHANAKYVRIEFDTNDAVSTSTWWITAVNMATGLVGSLPMQRPLNGGYVSISPGGIRIDGGRIVLNDVFGQAQIDGGGFGPVWNRFITSRVKNGDFVGPPPTPAANIDNSVNKLPHFAYTAVSGSITVKSVADSTIASGRKLVWTGASGAVGHRTYLEQIVPVNGSQGQSFGYRVAVNVLVAGGTPNTSDPTWQLAVQYLKIDGSTTGDEQVSETPQSSAPTGGAFELVATPNPTGKGSTPRDAYFIRVRVGMRFAAGGGIGAFINAEMYELRVIEGSAQIVLPDEGPTQLLGTGPYWPGRIRQRLGDIQIDAGGLGSGAEFAGVTRGRFAQVQAPTELPSTAALTLSTSDQDIAGCTLTYTPVTDEWAIVLATFDFNVSAAGVAQCVGKIVVNGTAEPEQAIFGMNSVGRASVFTFAVISLNKGTAYTIKLQALKTAAVGTALGGGAHTKIGFIRPAR